MDVYLQEDYTMSLLLECEDPSKTLHTFKLEYETDTLVI